MMGMWAGSASPNFSSASTPAPVTKMALTVASSASMASAATTPRRSRRPGIFTGVPDFDFGFGQVFGEVLDPRFGLAVGAV
jgi:hypothetical protein